MRGKRLKPAMIIILFFTLAIVFGMGPMRALAHCDRVNGPVAQDAREALRTGNFQPAAIWVGKEQTPELRRAFERSLSAYKQGGAGREVAEKYFMETTVRLHRAAEGFPYEGLKPAQPVAGDIAAAEKALETGNLKPVLDMLNSEIRNETSKLFQEARDARKNRNDSIEAGREWADAYVRYVIFVHGLHKKIEKGPAHGVGE